MEWTGDGLILCLLMKQSQAKIYKNSNETSHAGAHHGTVGSVRSSSTVSLAQGPEPHEFLRKRWISHWLMNGIQANRNKKFDWRLTCYVPLYSVEQVECNHYPDGVCILQAVFSVGGIGFNIKYKKVVTVDYI